MRLYRRAIAVGGSYAVRKASGGFTARNAHKHCNESYTRDSAHLWPRKYIYKAYTLYSMNALCLVYGRRAHTDNAYTFCVAAELLCTWKRVP